MSPLADLPAPLARAMVRSLTRGTMVPAGVRHLHVGHDQWLAAQRELLGELAEDGGAETKFVRGAYGSGKSHFLAVVQDFARQAGWVTSHVECKLHDVQIDRFETLYPRIVSNLRLPESHPEGQNPEPISEDPLRALLDSWTAAIFRKANVRDAVAVARPFESENKVYTQLREALLGAHLPPTFTQALAAYVRARLVRDAELAHRVVRWVRGDSDSLAIPAGFLRRPEASPSRVRERPQALRAIGTGTAHDALRGLLWLVSSAGHSGLVLCIDEIEELAKLRPRRRQDQALQALREHVDHAGGETGYSRLCLYLAATPEMFESQDYFPRYDALATRILPLGPEINWRAPVIDLDRTPLDRDQLAHVATRIRDVHEIAYPPERRSASRVPLELFVEEVLRSRVRIAKPRLLVRLVVDELERARQAGSSYTPPEDLAAAVLGIARVSSQEDRT